MHLEMNDDVKDWIRQKGSQMTVQLLEVKGCCTPKMQDMIVLPVKPKNTKLYQKIQVDDLSIYVYKPILLNKKITFQLKGFGIFKTVSAKVH